MNLFHLDARLPWFLPAMLVLAASLILGVAWISEIYGENLRVFDNRNLDPCQLCLVQRYPYALMVVLGAAAIVLARQAMERTLLLGIITLVLVFGSYVAGFHVGVEYGWWTAGSACDQGIEPIDPNFDYIDLTTDGGRPPPNCSEAAWRFPREDGLSMAGFNFFISIALALGTGAFALASLKRLPCEE